LRFKLFQSTSSLKKVALVISKLEPSSNYYTSLDWVLSLIFLKSIWIGKYTQHLPTFMYLCVAKLDGGQATDMFTVLISEQVMTNDLQQILDSRIDTAYDNVVIWLKQI